MKLGIAVVYLVSEENEKLLDLHLSQIERCTQPTYQIYGSVNRLLPRFRQKLAHHPRIKICEYPTTNLRGAEEHSYYLEQLVKTAIEDGVSHVVTLHLDSFPIRSDWVEELSGKLSETCPLAAIMRKERDDYKPSAECMFLSREFYLRHHPTFLLSEEELSSPAYKRYLQEFTHKIESGVGYGFKLYSEGLSWYSIVRSDRGEDQGTFGGIYGDIVFHLVGAASFTQDETPFVQLDPPRKLSPGTILLLNKIKKRVKGAIPKGVHRFLAPVNTMLNQETVRCIRSQLVESPESYLNYLRTGNK